MVMPFRASSKEAQLHAVQSARESRKADGTWDLYGSGSVETRKGYADQIIREYESLHPKLSYDEVLNLLEMHIEMDLLPKESSMRLGTLLHPKQTITFNGV